LFVPSSAATSAIVLPLRRDPDPEPISPELVLIDPVLAQRERAAATPTPRPLALVERVERPETKAPAPPEPPPIDISTLRRALEVAEVPATTRAPAAGSTEPRKRVGRGSALLRGLLVVSIFANGVFVSRLLTEHDRAPVVRAAPAVSSNAAARVTRSNVQPAPVAPRTPTTKAEVERAILSRMLQSPKRNIPRQLVDRTTGLFKTNVRTVCRHSHHSPSFLCVVKAPSADAHEGLYVKYSPTRSGPRFVWYGYRNG
jgi:hypothetical protein